MPCTVKQKREYLRNQLGRALSEVQKFLSEDRGTWDKSDYDNFSTLVSKADRILIQLEALEGVY